MGGRGRGASRSPATAGTSALAPEPLGYSTVSFETALGGAIYPFLEASGRAWQLLTYPVGEQMTPHPAHTFGQAAPTLRWVGDGQVTDLYVDGLTTEAFLTASGLELSMAKGGYVLSKRLSRVMRPYVLSGFFETEDVTIRYLDELDEAGRKVWDGAGVISRCLLRKLVLSDELEPAKRARLERAVATARRVEFTILTERGQDKGHAIVSDELEADVVLPRDTKGEIRLVNGKTFVGLGLTPCHDEMRLDIQSLINLHPFFEEEQLATWLQQEGALFLEAVKTGQVAEAMARVDSDTSLEDVTSWPLREYLASGGHPMWFPSHVRSLVNQHLARLNHSTLEKLRLPIPGGRYYVMPVALGRRAGLSGLTVGRGEIRIDPTSETAWVNDEDWLTLEDSPRGAGIAEILGGADNDDALWVHPFTDYDGTRQVLVWRSPNQPGEHLVLRPTADSAALPWATTAGTLVYPAGDSRQLGPRVDALSPNYLGLVDSSTAGGLGEGQSYSIAALAPALARAQANAGALGLYCNALMLNKALFEALPEQPPAPLEDVIDSAVKTGTDLSGVVRWVVAHSQAILAQRLPVPAVLQARLSREGRGRAPVPTSQDHWLDRLLGRVRAHIAEVEQQREELVAQTCPPRRLFDAAISEPEAIALGAQLNATYAGTLNQLRRAGAVPEEARLELARAAVETFLERYPSEWQTRILRGALISVAMSERGRSEAAAWLAGAKTEVGRALGVGHKTVEALREIGMLDEIGQTELGVLVYPGAEVQEPVYRTVGIHGVWFNWLEADLAKRGEAVPGAMHEVSQSEAKRAKRQVESIAQQAQILTLEIRAGDDGRQVAYTLDGRRFGTLSCDSSWLVGECLTIRVALAHDGNLRVLIE
jgi:hypothetical protein